MMAPPPAAWWSQLPAIPAWCDQQSWAGEAWSAWLAAGEASLWERLDPVRRTLALMTLLGLILIGFMLVALVLIGGRYVRRLARDRRQAAWPRDDDWCRQPLVPPPAADADIPPSDS